MTSNTNVSVWVAMIVVGIIAIGAYWYPSIQSATSGLLGTACDQITCIDGGLRITNGPTEATGLLAVTGDATISGGTLSVPSASTNATSTVAAGCVQTLATSTATPIKLVFNTIASTTGNGSVFWSYGTCPNL